MFAGSGTWMAGVFTGVQDAVREGSLLSKDDISGQGTASLRSDPHLSSGILRVFEFNADAKEQPLLAPHFEGHPRAAHSSRNRRRVALPPSASSCRPAFV